MHAKEHDRILRATARECMHTLGLHRYWKLGSVTWDVQDKLDEDAEATSYISESAKTIDIIVDTHVTKRALPWTLYHELYHLVTVRNEYLVRDHCQDETLKKLHKHLTEVAIDELVEITRWMLKERDKLWKEIRELKGGDRP